MPASQQLSGFALVHRSGGPWHPSAPATVAHTARQAGVSIRISKPGDSRHALLPASLFLRDVCLSHAPLAKRSLYGKQHLHLATRQG